MHQLRSLWQNSSKLNHRILHNTSLRSSGSAIKFAVSVALRQQQFAGYGFQGQNFCLKGSPKRKIRPAFVFTVSLLCVFALRPNEQLCVNQPLYLYLTISDRKFQHKVPFVLFGDRPRTANHSFNIFLYYNLHKLYGTCLGRVLCIVFTEKSAIDSETHSAVKACVNFQRQPSVIDSR